MAIKYSGSLPTSAPRTRKVGVASELAAMNEGDIIIHDGPANIVRNTAKSVMKKFAEIANETRHYLVWPCQQDGTVDYKSTGWSLIARLSAAEMSKYHLNGTLKQPATRKAAVKK